MKTTIETETRIRDLARSIKTTLEHQIDYLNGILKPQADDCSRADLAGFIKADIYEYDSLKNEIDELNRIIPIIES